MKRIIVAGALAAAISPFMAMGTADAATSPPPVVAIYPGNGLPLVPVTATAPARIYTPYGVITDEFGTGATVPAQYGGTRNGQPIPYPGWTATVTPSHVQLNFAVLTTPSGQQTVIEYVLNAANFWSTKGSDIYPTCMTFTVAATGQADWMALSGTSWVKAPGCQIPA